MSGEKTEQPTPRRLREARRKGQVARSRMLSASAVTLGGLLGFLSHARDGSAKLMAWTARLLLEQRAPDVGMEAARLVVSLSGPALGGALLAAFGVSVATVGFELNPAHVLPSLERVNPVAGFKRLFSGRAMLEVGKALVVTALVAFVVWREVVASGADALRSIWSDGVGGARFLGECLSGLCLRLAWLLLVLGVLDYLLARWRHRRDLMMSREEVRREHKESEGDPRNKGQRRALHRQLSQGGAARGVQKATAMVINPTHIAVALRYDSAECDAPYLVAKGREAEALALRAEALELGIPIIRDVPLARSLVHFDVGEPIPEELYQAAAVVLRTALEAKSSDMHPARWTP
ncbi:EscU/YscU/HrcU family type III secretion system export apparatus switch protein [Myxococcaceae bacterium JPH2]|nr:EscU/YscU/HrcU family type III secretion system export apparatus switch protein [Myxococcaceae bacterium JPH2]